MTRYGKPRWPQTVLFGSYRDLNYKVEIKGGESGFFRLRTQSGPGFRLTVVRAEGEPGFQVQGPIPSLAKEYWLSREPMRQALTHLLASHFSELRVQPTSISALCDPREEDLLPEGKQLTWCLSLIYQLWTAVPPESRLTMPRAEFIE